MFHLFKEFTDHAIFSTMQAMNDGRWKTINTFCSLSITSSNLSQNFQNKTYLTDGIKQENVGIRCIATFKYHCWK